MVLIRHCPDLSGTGHHLLLSFSPPCMENGISSGIRSVCTENNKLEHFNEKLFRKT